MYKILLDDVLRDVALLYDDVEWSGAVHATVMGEFGSGRDDNLLYDVAHDVTLLCDDITGEPCVPR